MARQRRTYTREFKVEAVKLVTEKGYSVTEAARSLDIGETLLRSWKQAFESEGNHAFPGHGNPPAIEEELRQLRADNKRLLIERDILKTMARDRAKFSVIRDNAVPSRPEESVVSSWNAPFS